VGTAEGAHFLPVGGGVLEIEGVVVGVSDGRILSEGKYVGLGTGLSDGMDVGASENTLVGFPEGGILSEGKYVGLGTGLSDGMDVG